MPGTINRSPAATIEAKVFGVSGAGVNSAGVIRLRLRVPTDQLEHWKQRTNGMQQTDGSIEVPVDTACAEILDGRDSDDPFHIDVLKVSVYFETYDQGGGKTPHAWITVSTEQRLGRVRLVHERMSSRFLEAALYSAPDGVVQLDDHVDSRHDAYDPHEAMTPQMS